MDTKAPVPVKMRRACLNTRTIARLALLLVVLHAHPADALQIAETAAPGASNRLNVLFLGDDGHHQPAARLASILPYMTDRGINIFYTDRLEDLNHEILGRYHVLAAYANHPHISPAQEAALLDFVANGGGFVAIHCASAMFGNSDAFAGLVGGAFKAHGEGTFRARIVEPDHPAMSGVPSFESWDETYIHMKHNPDRTVLAVRVDGDHEEPWTWVRTHGDGRVFYTASGHDHRTWSTGGFHRLLEQGIRWAAGDGALTADFAPPELEYAEATLPNYPPGVGWGVTGDPFTRLQHPLTPEASLQQAVLEPGFGLELFASEPDVINPIDLTWDERGRTWVIESVDYPNDFGEERRGNDRIRIIEDTDGDGRADAFTTFADGLNIPTGFTLANGGVIVAQAPDMLFLKDVDGDDRADERQVLFTGWGTFDTHAGPSNLRYGFDNQIWGAVGYSAFNGVVDGDSIRIHQGFYRFAPDGTGLEPIARLNNNTWGLGFTEDGLVFGSTANGNPSNFVAIPSRFYARLKDSFLGDPSGAAGDHDPIPVLHPIADKAEFYPVTTDVRQVDHHGRYTSAAGHEIYTARSFPGRYWNRAAFVAGPTGHLLGRFMLEPNGADFRARNEGSMVASRDAWFAPIQAKVGPDGALWIIDWYNPIIQHNPTPPDYETGAGNAYETPLRDRQHSRIYRLVYDRMEDGNSRTDRVGPPVDRDNGSPQPGAEYSYSLADATAEDLVRALREDNLHWRLTAQRLLVERGETGVLPHLYRVVRDVRVDELGLNPGAIHALWTIHGLGALDGSNREARAVAASALHHPSPAVRRAALMVLPADEESRDVILQSGLLPDPSTPAGMSYVIDTREMAAAEPQVRLTTLLTLADMPPSAAAGRAIAELALLPEIADDRWLRDASAIAGARHASGFVDRMLQADLEGWQHDSTYVANLSRIVGSVSADFASRRPASDIAETLLKLQNADVRIGRAVLHGFAAGPASPPSFTDTERAALHRLSDEMPADLQKQSQSLAELWQLLDLSADEDEDSENAGAPGRE